MSSFVLSLTCGCASIHNEYLAMTVDATGALSAEHRTRSGLVISAGELTAYSSDYFGLVELTFENTTSEWLHIDRVGLHFFGGGERDALVKVPVGNDFDTWYRATLHRNDIEGSNEALALAAIFAVGATAHGIGKAHDSEPLKAAGGLLAFGAGTSMIAEGVDERVERAEHASPVPETHLLALPFGVPPGLFTKRWLLLQTRSAAPCLVRLVLDYHIEGRGHEIVVVPFRKRGTPSEWQANWCR